MGVKNKTDSANFAGAHSLMQFSSKILEEAVNQFSRLPGIGKKTALRLILHLLKAEETQTRELVGSLLRLKTDLRFCKECHNISDHELCNICSDKSRQEHLVCVVEDLRDVMAIENTSQFRGRYHVLGGLISPVDGIGPEDLAIESLLERISAGHVHELIFALAATMEGDTTTFYISKKIKTVLNGHQSEESELRMTTIARGIAVGGELEYADEITLGRSILARVPYKI